MGAVGCKYILYILIINVKYDYNSIFSLIKDNVVIKV